MIFGDANPSGHLPVTFPEKTEDLPDFSDYSMQGRTYRYATKTPLYPFGFGLTYTEWKFSNLECKKESDGVRVSVKVNNIGNADGKECVQVYVQKNNRNQDDPLYSLKAFKKVSVKKGESAEVKFNLPLKAFETITEEGESEIQTGEYTIIISDSAPDPVAVTLGASEWIKGSVNI
ncbi:MAG: fibronectin type III-like domain-contianing protein [Treponema sp.]|nr:fibronectin type III-like domain-contianing protein [Treponema sp.]